MEWSTVIVLCSTFFFFLFLGVPISFAIGLSSLITIMLSIPFDAAITVISQKMASGLDSFSLLAIPFFILAGNIMNRGGIALRLIEFAKVIGGRLPGP
ncbi:tripartite ATP-independent transporter DctM subunit [Testudinibacter aquarius]|uniref:Tripartite ATP-independent transporter DctM subunit n=1 Tax=Testudinibacter aquarius TaxID=1524974 RepID=A0A4R3YBJ3_9PAST|nr:tripartite ATP-independent transporter DctM subunit [Testudinibacter aquarius]